MKDRSLFKRLFWYALVPQLAVCILYWLFGIDYGGGETDFQRMLTFVYAPGAVITMLLGLLLFGGWAGVGFSGLAFPLVGAILYSLAFAAIGYAAKTGLFKAFLSLFRSGV